MIEETTVETIQAVEETVELVTEPIEESTAPFDPVDLPSIPDLPLPSETYEVVLPTEEYGSDYIVETAPETVPVVTVDIIETASSNIVHASLFGSFLVCGTLVGIFLLRGRYGT